MLRTFGALLTGMILLAPAWAANPGDRSPSNSELQTGELYARQLGNLVHIIAEQYVREVSPALIYESALIALYETARQPVPAGLLLDLRKAENAADQQTIVALARARLGSLPQIEGNRDLTASIKGLPNALDPYCGLVVAHEFQNRGDTTINFGFDLEGDTGDVQLVRTRLPALGEAPPQSMPSLPFRVLAVRPGGPAQGAGLRPGDVITRIDDRTIAAESAAGIYQDVFLGAIDPNDSKEHNFTVQRSGKQGTLSLKIRKSIYVPESIFGVNRGIGNEWNYWLDAKKKIAYVRIGPIESGTPQQLAAAVGSVPDAKGLILDLRWCPGGYLNQSAEIAGMFLEKGQVASVKYRHPDRQGSSEFRAETVGIARYRAPNVPLLVLVNGDTLGGGELIACALQDNLRAVVAGQRTRGKASIQSPLYIPSLPGWTFKLTAGTFLRPSGKNLQRFPDSGAKDDWGVRPNPNLEITVSPSLGQQLKEWNLLYALRPGGDREAMPLDDPEADPQRWTALKMIRKIVEEAEKNEN